MKLKALSEAVARLSGQLEETQDKNKSLRGEGLEWILGREPGNVHGLSLSMRLHLDFCEG